MISKSAIYNHFDAYPVHIVIMSGVGGPGVFEILAMTIRGGEWPIPRFFGGFVKVFKGQPNKVKMVP